MWRFFRVFKPAHCKVADFREGRTRQSDADFLRDCGVEPGTKGADIALAVRRAVAGVDLVDPLFVHCNDSYPGTLEVLPLWDSMDWLALVFELERELDHTVQWQPGEIQQHSQCLTVTDLIAHVRRVLEQGPTVEPTVVRSADAQAAPPVT